MSTEPLSTRAQRLLNEVLCDTGARLTPNERAAGIAVLKEALAVSDAALRAIVEKDRTYAMRDPVIQQAEAVLIADPVSRKNETT